jgi:hypothetical protein
MNRRSRRRATVLLLLAGLLAASASFAAAPGIARPTAISETAAGDLLHRAWSLFTRFWSKAGCNIDPNGSLCAASPAPKEGCHIDPSGRCGS